MQHRLSIAGALEEDADFHQSFGVILAAHCSLLHPCGIAALAGKVYMKFGWPSV